MLLTSQYSTSPEGNPQNIKVKRIGIVQSIICAWRGSPLVGVIFCWTHILTPIRRASRLNETRWPAAHEKENRETGRVRSRTQRKLAPHIATELRSAL